MILSQDQPEPFRTIIEVVVQSLVNKTNAPPSKSYDLSSTSHDHQEATGSNPITYSSTGTLAPHSSQQASSRSIPTTATTSTGLQSTLHINQSTSSQQASSRSTERSTATTSTTAAGLQSTSQSTGSKSTTTRATTTKSQSALKQSSISSTVNSGGVLQAGHRTVSKKVKHGRLINFEATVDRSDSDSLFVETSADSVSVDRVTRQSAPLDAQSNTLFGDVSRDVGQRPAGGNKVVSG